MCCFFWCRKLLLIAFEPGKQLLDVMYGRNAKRCGYIARRVSSGTWAGCKEPVRGPVPDRRKSASCWSPDQKRTEKYSRLIPLDK